MSRKAKKPNMESGDEAAAAAPAQAASTSRLTVFEAKELIMKAMKDAQAVDYLRFYLEKNLRLEGWRDSVKKECHNYIRERGPENVNVSHMISDLLPAAKASVKPRTREELKTILRAFALEVMTVDDSVPPPIEKEVPLSQLQYELQPRDTIPEPGTELLFTRQGTLPQYKVRAPVPPQPPATPPVGVKSPQALVVLDRIDREREKENKDKLESLAKEKEKLVKEEEKEKVDKEREKKKADKEREKEKAEREREKAEKVEREREKLEKLEREREKVRDKERHDREREQKDRDRHERQERHNLNLVSLSASLPASPRSPSIRSDKKKPAHEPSTSKLGSHAKAHARPVPEPIKATGLASTLLSATAAIAGKKSKHINLNSDDEDDDEDDEELMDI